MMESISGFTIQQASSARGVDFSLFPVNGARTVGTASIDVCIHIHVH